MANFTQTIKNVEAMLNNSYCIAVMKDPRPEEVMKAVAGTKYFCTDSQSWVEAKEGQAVITRRYPDGKIDTYMNKNGPKYNFENGKTWDEIQPGESAIGTLKGGPEYDRVAMLANPNDTVQAVWDETQKVTRDASFVTIIYNNKEFNMEGDNKWGSKQIVLNNNAGDTYPIDTKLKDENGNPVKIGEVPLTASPEALKKALEAHIQKYYKGKLPEHLQANMNIYEALETREKIRSSKLKVAAKSNIGEKGTVTPKQSQEKKAEVAKQINAEIIRSAGRDSH